MVSTVLKNQFMASMVAMSVGFMPALMLSGLMFPINSMPVFFQHLTRIIPPRYYISFIESEFMAGGVNEIRLANAFYLTVLGLILFTGFYKKTQMRLERPVSRGRERSGVPFNASRSRMVGRGVDNFVFQNSS